MLYLTNKALKFESLVELFNQEVLVRAEPKSHAPSLLTQFRKKLQGIYFPNIKKIEDISPKLITEDLRFETYPELKQALLVIFGSEDKEAIQAQLMTIIPTQLSTANAETQWENLNHSLHYFEGNDLLPLFTELTQACRAMSVLIEDNLADEEMPHIYAYRLMALFASQNPTTSFEQIAKKTYDLLNQQPKDKPYHDVILNQIQLPMKDEIRDLDGWLTLLNSKTGIAFLPYFAMAPQIEAQIHKDTGTFKAPRNLKEAKTMASRCYYTRAAENTKLAELCRAYNIPEDGDECSFNKCLDYLKSLPQWPMKDSDNLPHPVIVGSGAAEGYCWVKLPTDDLRALILGRMTACCQSIGGNSEQCVNDAITLSDNGLYVLLKRKDKAPHDSQPYIGNKINDANFVIVGQSYAWISMIGNLTLDSLECSIGRVTTAVIQALLSQFAGKALKENPSIKRITLGSGGGTPRDIGFPLVIIPEDMRTGFKYGDSDRQLIIARQQKIADVEFDGIMIRLNIDGEFKDVLHYLSDYLSDTSHFEEELTQLLKDIPNLTSELTPKSLFRLLFLTSTPTLNELRPVDFDRLKALSDEEKTIELSQISTARLAWRDMNPERFLEMLNYIPLAQHLIILHAHKGILRIALMRYQTLLPQLLDAYPIQKRFVALNEKNNVGNSIIEELFENHRLLKSLLEKLTKSDQVKMIKDRDESEHSLLYLAIKNLESLKILLDFLSEDERIMAILEKNKYGDTVLNKAIAKPESLKLLLTILPEDKRLNALKEKNNRGETILHQATDKPESFRLLISMHPKDTLLNALKEKNNRGETVLEKISSNPDLLKTIINRIPEHERYAALMIKDKNGMTIYHSLATKNPSLIKMFLDMLPEKEQHLARLEQNKRGSTIFHEIINDPKLLKLKFQDLPISERLAAINHKNWDGNTVLHLALSNPELLLSLLEMLPQKDRLTAINELNSSGESILHQSRANPELLKAIIATIPESDYLAALHHRTSSGYHSLHLVAKNPNLLRELVERILPKQRLDTFSIMSPTGNNLLAEAKSNHDSAIFLLSMLDESERLKLLKQKTSRDSCLKSISKDIDLLYKILLLLSKKDRLTALQGKITIDTGFIFFEFANKPEYLKSLLSAYSKSERLELIKINDASLNIFHFAANNPKSLEVLLENTPKDDLYQMIQEKDSAGNTVLHFAANNTTSLKRLFENIPEHKLFQIMQLKNRKGSTILDFADYNPDLLNVILEALPLEKLKDLPPKILQNPQVEFYIAQRTARESPSQATLGLFKPEDKTDEGSSTPTP